MRLDSNGTIVWNTPCGNYTAVVELPDGDFAAIKSYPVWNSTPKTFNGTWGNTADVVLIHEGIAGETLRPNITKNAQHYTLPNGFGIFWVERGGTWHTDEVNLVKNLTVSRPINLPWRAVRASNGGYFYVDYISDDTSPFSMEARRYDANGSVIWEKQYANVTSPKSTTDRFPTRDGGLIYLGARTRLREAEALLEQSEKTTVFRAQTAVYRGREFPPSRLFTVGDWEFYHHAQNPNEPEHATEFPRPPRRRLQQNSPT